MLAVKVVQEVRGRQSGPSSPSAKKPAIGAASVAAATRAASWSGSPKPAPRPLQENSRTPRGRHRDTGGEQQLQVLVGGVGVADVELVSDLDAVGDGDRAGLRVGPEQAPDQEAPVEAGLCARR